VYCLEAISVHRRPLQVSSLDWRSTGKVVASEAFQFLEQILESVVHSGELCVPRGLAGDGALAFSAVEQLPAAFFSLSVIDRTGSFQQRQLQEYKIEKVAYF